MKLSIIIVSYNVRHYVEQCLLSVYASLKQGGIDGEVFVVDNDSPDNSAGYIAHRFPADRFPALHIIPNARNVGFGRANNQAIRRSKGEYVLFLNPDTIITEHTLKDALDFADAHPDLGVMGVRMISGDGRFAPESRRGLPTPWVSFCKMTGLGALFPKSRRFGRYYMRYLPDDQPCPIDIVSGAFMLCRRESLNKVGYFDEAFFMYGEDIDLSYRFLKAGFQNYYIPTPILHYKGESTKKNTYHYVHTFYEAMLIFFRKHFASSLLLTLPIRLAIYTRALMALVGQWFRGIGDFLTSNRTRRADLYAYDANAPQADVVADIAERNGIDLLATPTPSPDRPVDAVIYDAAETSFAEMIETLAANPRHDYALGTFNPHTGVLIACHQTYE